MAGSASWFGTSRFTTCILDINDVDESKQHILWRRFAWNEVDFKTATFDLEEILIILQYKKGEILLILLLLWLDRVVRDCIFVSYVDFMMSTHLNQLCCLIVQENTYRS